MFEPKRMLYIFENDFNKHKININTLITFTDCKEKMRNGGEETERGEAGEVPPEKMNS
jgi:hypothetical protein